MNVLRRGIALGVVAAIGTITASALGAVSGTTHKVPGVLDFQGVGCPPSGACVAAGESPRNSKDESTGVFATITNGKPGTAHQVPGTSVLNHVACPKANFCIAVGSAFSSSGQHALYVEINHGKAGTVQSLKINGVASIGCGSSTSCWAAGDDYPSNPTGPSSFHPEVVHLVNGKVAKVYSPPGNYDFFAGEVGGAAPVCFSATSCILVGAANFNGGPGAIFSLAGGKVKIAHTVSGTNSLSGLYCTSKESCTIVGYTVNGAADQGDVFTLSSSGVGKIHKVNVGLFPLGCASMKACFSFGSTYHSGKVTDYVVSISQGSPGSPEAIDTAITAATCRGTECLGVGAVGAFPKEQGTVFAFKG
jgi:hypothetical protein